ncbi:MAG TPA: BlaI/MecI/CopY family transcriptional regulator [Longimicrobiales bacterium]|nr:BlaI/MecI/CopY family transcriptional regulator [Longimicrobiales bacterium]
MADLNKLPPRERQIMDFLIANSGGTVADVLEGIKDPPSYSAVRAMLTKLERKGYIAHDEIDRAFRYRPIAKDSARRSAVRHLLDTFFGGSATQAVSAILKSDDELSDDDLERLEKLVTEARRGGRK